jgi:hypothetical protein
MDLREKALFHQIHPLKLATDVTCGIASTWLMWRHELELALLVGFLPSVLVSAAMIRWMSLEAQRDSALGRYVARWMTPAAQAARLSGQLLMWAAAWARAPIGIACGLLVIVGAWTYGLLLSHRT